MKTLEEKGIGRPSTYASIMQTIQDRGYVWKKGQALVPTTDAFAVVALLEQHFSHLVDYEFTARMEDDLDEIAGGRQQRVPWLHQFWFGNGTPGVKGLKDKALEEADAEAINTIPLGVDENGEPIVIRNGRYGPYLKRGDDTASIPEDLPLDELTIDRAVEILSAPKGGEPLGDDPETGLPVFAKSGRFGPYVQLGDADTLPPDTKPKMSSLFQTMTLSTLTLEEALQLLRLPRTVGAAPGRRQGDRRRQRPLRPVREVGRRDAQPRDRGAAPHRHARRGREGPRRAEEVRTAPGRAGAAAQGARQRPRVGEAGGGEGRPLRSLRHRRRDERQPPQGRHGRERHHRAGRGAAADPPRGRPGQEGAQGREEGAGQEGDRQEGDEDTKKAPAKKAAKKAAPPASE